MVLLVVASYTLYYHNSVASYDRAIGVQERALEEMEKTRSSLYAQVEDIRTSDEILKTARFQLGMVYPGEDQIEYIEVAPTEEEVARDNVFANPVISVLQFLRP
ncbi:MAG: septum formation initiator family protein [Tissierellia bacterium]|nr:septum formation initiator family protein [Tissierellia bacterium]